MTDAMTVILIFLLIAVPAVYLFVLRGRRNHPGLAALRGWGYAHRGLHDQNRPENSLSAFQAALDGGYGVELDVHLLKDGTLAVFHDGTLDRVVGRPGKVAELTAGELNTCFLLGSDQAIPTFQEVLALFSGKAPLIVELKPDDGNHAALCRAVCDALDGYDGVYCLESFDPRCVRWLRHNRPELLRGQLSENFFASTNKMSWPIKLVLTAHLMNFLTLPDFVAYKFSDRKRLGTWLCRKLHRLQGVTWTVKTQADYDKALSEGWIPIFEGFLP